MSTVASPSRPAIALHQKFAISRIHIADVRTNAVLIVLFAELGRNLSMHLTPREIDKLMIVVAADVARRRRSRGLKLNHPEALALITAELLEAIRDGRSVSEVMEFGGTILAHDDVMEGVAEMLDEVQVEGTFPDGTKLVTVHHPIR